MASLFLTCKKLKHLMTWNLHFVGAAQNTYEKTEGNQFFSTVRYNFSLAPFNSMQIPFCRSFTASSKEAQTTNKGKTAGQDD